MIREKISAEGDPIHIKTGREIKENKQGFFERILDKILKLKNLKMFELAIGFVKGFSVKVEYFEGKNEK